MNAREARMRAECDAYRVHYNELVKRDKMICGICGIKIKTVYDASIDHILARCLGGSNDIENLQLVHKICNLNKGKKEAMELKRKLRGKI